jgi:hypothetical protein
MTTFVLTVLLSLGAGAAMAFAADASRGPRLILAGVVGVGTSCAVIATLFGDDVDDDWLPQLTMYAGVLAVCGGHLVSRGVLEVVDSDGKLAVDSLLPGGSWIGALERLAIFVSLVSGMPEGVAVVLAVKGLGRYPELKVDRASRADGNVDRSAVGERFIIGTFVSVLWAAACAYLVLGQPGALAVLR